MTITETLTALFAKAISDPRTLAYGEHVYILFHDGELTLTKAGELFGQRRFAMMHGGCVGVKKSA
jgi:hypothetical protein